MASDPLEQGIYSLFQSIGIASIGFGAYKWKVGDENRLIITSLKNSQDLSDEQKYKFIMTYNLEKAETDVSDKKIRAITHGLIALLNFYNASQYSHESVKNTLVFIGTANLLASLSYTF